MKNIHIVSVGLWLLFAPATEGLYASTDAAMIERHCTIRALGDACIFDIVAAADGELSICTKPDRTGDQWRATLARRYTHSAVSAVGVGRTDVCSGSAQMPMVAAGEYIGIVTWSDPSRTPLPRTVAVSFAGPMQSVSSARPNVAQANEMGTCSNDPQRLSCGSIVSCQLEPAGDTDLFTFEAPAGSRAYVSIRGPVGTYLQLFDPSGTAIGQRTVRDAAAPLQTDGQYALEAYNFFNADGEYQVSLQGISSSFRCGIDLAYGETRIGELKSNAQIDTYHVLGRSDHRVQARISGPTGTYFQLFDPDGNPIGNRCAGECSATLNDGVHTFLVYNYFGGLGDYSLTLQLVSGSQLGVLPR